MFKNFLPHLAGIFLGIAQIQGQTTPPIQVDRDVVYSTAAQETLRMDIYRPVKSENPKPVIVYFHGGGWQKGDKKDPVARMRFLAGQGYVAASVQYRFAPKYKFPSQIEDAKAAVRFLKHKAAEYGIDPGKVVAMGDSAGGYLALMLGATQPKDGFEGTVAAPTPSSQVQAVVNWYGGVDLRGKVDAAVFSPEAEKITRDYYGKDGKTVLTDFIGSSDPQSPILDQIAVTTWIDSGDAPVLSFYGDQDPFGGEKTGQLLHSALKRAGVHEALVVVKGGGHGGWGPAKTEMCHQEMLRFLKENLK